MTTIAIVGPPGAGKTTLAAAAPPGWRVVHTDDLVHLGWDEQPQAALDLVGSIQGENLLVEGCLVGRMLSRGWQPDLVLDLEGPPDTDPRHAGLATQVIRGVRAYQARGGWVAPVARRKRWRDL